MPAAAPRAFGLLEAALLTGPLAAAGGGGVASRGAVVTVSSAPAGGALAAGARFPGLFADFSGPPPGGPLAAWALADVGVPPPLRAAAPAVAVVRRGSCTFEQKALRAQSGGAAGLVVARDVSPMGRNASNTSSGVDIFVVGIARSFGDALAGDVGRAPAASLLLSFAVYELREPRRGGQSSQGWGAHQGAR
ncbi:unnamed protein product [Prorocentrum cordatum]|uniref:PA domain-containing protein n=1 Tax=Prorocentrum cordatum TaxID=2364126 RepID=A0ABN9PB88_9DINO|nr:unnamed protein product [Polarella glacialis]